MEYLQLAIVVKFKLIIIKFEKVPKNSRTNKERENLKNFECQTTSFQ